MMLSQLKLRYFTRNRRAMSLICLRVQLLGGCICSRRAASNFLAVLSANFSARIATYARLRFPTRHGARCRCRARRRLRSQIGARVFINDCLRMNGTALRDETNFAGVLDSPLAAAAIDSRASGRS